MKLDKTENTMRKVKLFVLALVIGASCTLLSGCSSTRVYSDYVEGIDYSAFKTFAWLPSTDTSRSLYDNAILMQNLRNRINEEMTERGYTIDTKSPDVLLLLRTCFEPREELIRTPIYSSYSYYYPGFYVTPGYPYYYNYYNTIPSITGYNIRSVEFTLGTIVIDMVNAKTDELIWRGWAKTNINNSEDLKREMNKVVDDIYHKYPVKKKK